MHDYGILITRRNMCRLMTGFMSNQRKYTLNSVLRQLSCPLLLVWGDLDPWVGPAKALRIKEFYPNTSLVNLQAGHCPHDEVPELVNKALLEWLSSTPSLQAPWTLFSACYAHQLEWLIIWYVVIDRKVVYNKYISLALHICIVLPLQLIIAKVVGYVFALHFLLFFLANWMLSREWKFKTTLPVCLVN